MNEIAMIANAAITIGTAIVLGLAISVAWISITNLYNDILTDKSNINSAMRAWRNNHDDRSN